MTRSERMYGLAEVEDREAREASRALAEAEQTLARHEHSLDQLQRYLAEYTSPQAVSRASNGAASRLADFRAFIARLERAISEQRRVVAASREHCESRRSLLREHKVRAGSLEKVAARMRGVERRCESRREQSRIDDISANATTPFED